MATVVQLAIPVFGLWLWHQIRTTPPMGHYCFGPFTDRQALISSGCLAGCAPVAADVDETRQ